MTFAIPTPLPHCLHFPSKFKLFSPLWILPTFSAIPLWGSQIRLIPLFVLLKIKWSPKILRPLPPLQAINDDRSLNRVTPNWLDTNQLPIYKCGRGFEPWTIANKSSWRSRRDLNLGSPNSKSRALMAQSRCLLSLILWETAHLPLP